MNLLSPKNGIRTDGSFSLLGTASVMGLHMVSGPIAGAGLGWLLDHFLGTWPACTGAGVLFGIAAGFLNVWTDAKYLLGKNSSQEAKEGAQDKNPPSEAKKTCPRPEIPATAGENPSPPPSPKRLQEIPAPAGENAGHHKSSCARLGGQLNASEGTQDDEDAFFLASLMAGTAVPGQGKHPVRTSEPSGTSAAVPGQRSLLHQAASPPLRTALCGQGRRTASSPEAPLPAPLKAQRMP